MGNPHGNISSLLTSLGSRVWLILATATLLPRVFLALYLGVLGQPEWWEYDVIAANIASGAGHTYDRFGFVYAAYAPPLWSYLLAGLLQLPGDRRVGIQAAQALLCLGAAGAFAAVARRVSNHERAGLLAGLLVALQPSLLYYSVVKSDPLPLNVFLLGLIAMAGSALIGRPRDLGAVGFGVLVGLGVLARGTPIVALPLSALALLIRYRLGALRPIAIATLACVVCVAPWIARNVAVIGAPLITSTTGENFWRGNNDLATGGVRALRGQSLSRLDSSNEALSPTIREVLAHGTEADRDRVFMSEALGFMLDQPERALRLFMRKMDVFWWRIDSDPADYSVAATLSYEWIYRLEFALALAGAFAVFKTRLSPGAPPDRMTAALVIALMIAISVLQSAFYVQGRHRFLIEPLLLIFTACGAVAATRAAKRRLVRRSPSNDRREAGRGDG